ncbi:MAG: hypothetical protein HC769_07945 [Cyanobacteria bacterium CRU_2_1]|nr:hypothetical protein [Cyanobacteria bacterium CRU_2_1]
MIAANLFHYVSEQEDNFLALFPHRYDYIWAEYPDVQEAIDWKTESRHPLTDRLIHQGQYVYGVRFAAETQYSVIDIDTTSRYHPKHDPFAISRIVAALEPLGFVAYVACTSSDSGGIHLYVPFQQKQKSWKLAIALQTLLENAGFKPAAGQLEIFPNPKRYATERTPSLYAAHRLPMQIGSYLLNEDWQLTYSNQAIFVERWQFAQAKNDVCSEAIDQALSTFRRKQYGISGRVDKFLNDLNADIEAGWTGQGQTNFILGRIAMRSYIFGHLLYADCPLEGKPLVDDIVKTARSLPGYQEWCRHQHEIEKRAEEWARCIENSRYFHFGRSKLAPAVLETADSSPQSSWNQKQSESARERICKAIADLLNQNALPFGATARFHALTQYGIGGGSLYRHRDLWHPNFLKADFVCGKPPRPPNALTNVSVDASGVA